LDSPDTHHRFLFKSLVVGALCQSASVIPGVHSASRPVDLALQVLLLNDDLFQVGLARTFIEGALAGRASTLANIFKFVVDGSPLGLGGSWGSAPISECAEDAARRSGWPVGLKTVQGLLHAWAFVALRKGSLDLHSDCERGRCMEREFMLDQECVAT